MKLLFRLLWLVLTQSFRSRTDIMGPVETRLRVYPNDLDIFLHVNNGVYLTYADLGRTDLLLRANAFHKIRKRGWYPVIASQTIQIKKSLKLGQVFSINTRVIGWSDKAVYMEQVYMRGETFIARALVDARFLSLKGERVSNQELLDLLGLVRSSPTLPNYLQLWIDSSKAMAAANKSVVN